MRGELRERWRALARPAVLAGATAAATLVNPYGWELHKHVAEESRLALEVVEEGAGGHAGGFRDLGRRGRRVALSGEQGARGA